MIGSRQTRRLFLKTSVLALSGIALAGCDQRPHVELELEPEPSFQFFDVLDAAILVDIADLMIPQTETAGAAETKTALYLDQLLTTWASEQTRSDISAAVKVFDQRAQEQGQKSYLDMLVAARLELLKQVDQTSFSVDKEGADAANFRKLKRLVFHIHYSSEAANPDFVLIPGQYRGDIAESEYNALVEENRL